MIPASQMKVGMVINYRGDFCKVLSVLNQAMGRGSSKVSSKLKNLQNGSNVEAKFRSDEKVETIRIEARELEFLYESSGEYIFMMPETYDQIHLSAEMVEDIKLFMKPNFTYTIEFFEDKPIGIFPPRTLDLEVMETEPKMKGATAASSLKPATLETGVVVGVPSFVEVGDIVRIDTTETKYMERV